MNEQATKSQLILEPESRKPIEATTYFKPDLMSPADQQVRAAVAFMVHECCADPYETFKMQVLAALMLDGPNSLFYKHLI